MQDHQKQSLLNDDTDHDVENQSCCCLYKFWGRKKLHQNIIPQERFNQINKSQYALNGARENSFNDNDQPQNVLFKEQLVRMQTPLAFKASQAKHQEIPKNKLFLLKSKGPNNTILAKQTEIVFNFNVLKDKTIDKQTITEIIIPQEVFKLFDFGIESTTDSWSQTTPELIAKIIAKRVVGQSLIVDLGCGIGGNTIQFAQACDFVIAVDINEQSLKHAKNNAIKYGVEEKVDFVFANLLNLRKLRASTVFINPTINNHLQVDLYRDCQPNIFQIMEKALHIAPNIILQLPKNIDINQLPAIFDLKRYQFLQDNYPFNYAIEIQAQIVNKKTEFYIIFFGEVSAISDEESNQFLAKQLMLNGNEYDGFDISDRINDILVHIKSIIGAYKMFNLVRSSIKQCPKHNSLIQFFLNNAINSEYITIQQVKSFRPLQSLNEEKLQQSDCYASSYPMKPEQRLNNQLSKSGNKREKNISPPEDQILSPSEYSFKSDNYLGSDPLGKQTIYSQVPYSQDQRQDLLEYSNEDEKAEIWDFSQMSQQESSK